MRSNQEEQNKYFYIDRKFGSGNPQEIAEALDEIDLFLGNMKKIDLINSLVMRMLDLLQNARSFHIKSSVASIFRHHSSKLVVTHSRDEIAAVLAKCLKGSDQYTRIVALEMVRTLSSLFLKDIAVYHTLLSKIALNYLSKIQKKESIICLAELFKNSRQLSKIFSKNITQINQLYQIPNHILIYLLTFVAVDSHLQKRILEQILLLIQQIRKTTKSQVKKQFYYFQKLVMNYALNNYKIIEFYQSKLKYLLPRLEGYMNKLKIRRFPFLKHLPEEQTSKDFVHVEQFIDQLYEMKRQNNQLEQFQPKIHQIIRQVIKNPSTIQTSVMLLYFICDDISGYDKKIYEIIRNNTSIVRMKFFKKLIVLGCFESANLMLSDVMVTQEIYIILKVYLQFKGKTSQQYFHQMQLIFQVLSSSLFALSLLWNKIHIIMQQKQANTNFSQLFTQLIQEFNTFKGNNQNDYIQQMMVISIILQNISSTQDELKRKCYYILPSHINCNKNYWFAHLSKSTVISLLNTNI